MTVEQARAGRFALNRVQYRVWVIYRDHRGRWIVRAGFDACTLHSNVIANVSEYASAIAILPSIARHVVGHSLELWTLPQTEMDDER